MCYQGVAVADPVADPIVKSSVSGLTIATPSRKVDNSLQHFWSDK